MIDLEIHYSLFLKKRLKKWNQEMGLRLIQLEEENKNLRMQTQNFQQSIYTDYTASQPDVHSKVSEHFQK